MRLPFPSIKVVLAATVLFQISLSVSSSGATGALTLQSNATIDFKSADGGSESVFQPFNVISGTVADIVQWTATVEADGSDRLLATNPNLTSHDLQPVQFANYADTNFAIGEMSTADNGYYELAQAPEPTTWAAAGMTLLAVAVSQRRRLTRLRGSWR
jgi:hypothetical protein